MPAQRVLIVEDELALRALLERFVQRAGYGTRTVASAEEALETLDNPADAFDCFLVDLSLPGLSGDELARRALERFPESRVIIMSGYPYDPLPLGPPSQVAFLQKPFLPKHLVELLRRLNP